MSYGEVLAWVDTKEKLRQAAKARRSITGGCGARWRRPGAKHGRRCEWRYGHSASRPHRMPAARGRLLRKRHTARR